MVLDDRIRRREAQNAPLRLRAEVRNQNPAEMLARNADAILPDRHPDLGPGPGTQPFANVRSCQVSCRARTHACSASASAFIAGGSCRIVARAIETLPMTAIRMLLKSCAIPPARSPSDARLPAFARSS